MDYDIVLLYLRKVVNYIDFVSFICLVELVCNYLVNV